MDVTEIPAGSIVVGIDGSPWSDAALGWAIEQAGLERRPLTLVHSVEPPTFPGIGASTGIDFGRFLDEIQDAATTLMAESAARALECHPELDVYEVLSHRDPRSTLLHLGEQAGMLVLGSRGRGLVSSLLLGSVSVSVSKHAACPVVVVRPVDETRSRQGVAVGVDGTTRSGPAIEFAYRIAGSRRLPLTVLHCYWGVSLTAAADGSAVPDLSEQEGLVADSIAGMDEKFPEVEVTVRLLRGFADQRLVAASREYDLLIVGHERIGVVADLVHGSMAPTVVEQSHSMVAVVPSHVSTPVTTDQV